MSEPAPSEDPSGDVPSDVVNIAPSAPPAAVRRPGHPTEIAGRYRIHAKIADGGMGVVYRAEHVLSKKKLAIKVLYPHLTHGNTAVERFRREVSAAAEIDHPGIVQVFDAGVDTDGTFYMAMELLDGEPLSALMRRKWPGTRRALELILELCEPLARAHEKGFIHRDLKPENIFLAKDPETGVVRLKLLDFGLARDVGKKGATQSGVTFGTPEYMAPEQSLSAKNASMPADVWSVGVMLYELLSGFHPFVGDSPNAIMIAAIKEPHVPLAERAPHVPPAIVSVVERCLEKIAADRIQTAGVLSEDLHRAIDGSELDDRAPSTTHLDGQRLEPDAPADLTGIPSADDKDLARVRRVAQRDLATEVAQAPTPDAARAKRNARVLAIVAGVISIALVIVFAYAGRTPPPEMTATPMPPPPVAPPPAPIVEPTAEAPIAPPEEVRAAVAPVSPDEPIEQDAPILEEDAPVAEAPRPRAPSIALEDLTPEESTRAQACLSHADYACALAIYRRSRNPHDLVTLINTLTHVGRTREALPAMRDFVRRFPRASQTPGYRSQLAAAGM
jgi:tRNA A-37 threonylcarbamoyl transferase component Bud32